MAKKDSLPTFDQINQLIENLQYVDMWQIILEGKYDYELSAPSSDFVLKKWYGCYVFQDKICMHILGTKLTLEFWVELKLDFTKPFHVSSMEEKSCVLKYLNGPVEFSRTIGDFNLSSLSDKLHDEIIRLLQTKITISLLGKLSET